MRTDAEGGVMYGYRIINGKAVIDEKEASVIREILICYNET